MSICKHIASAKRENHQHRLQKTFPVTRHAGSTKIKVNELKDKGGLYKQKTQTHRQAGQAGKHDLLSIVDIDLGLGLPVDTINGGK